MKSFARPIEGIAVVAAAVVLAAGVHQRVTAPREAWDLSADERRQLRDHGNRPLVFPGVFRDTIVLFLDYRCPSCAVLYPDLVRTDARYAVVVRHLAGPKGSLSAQAAIAAECARREDRLHAYSYALFARRDSIGSLAWEEFGRAAHMDEFARFSHCIENREPVGLIEADTELGMSLGLPGTPAALLRGRVHVGAAEITRMLNELNPGAP